MIRTQSCDDCAHNKVCKKKDDYTKFIEAAGKLTITCGPTAVMFIADSQDFELALECKHKMPNYPGTRNIISGT